MDRINSESTPMSKKLASCSKLADGYWHRFHHAADDWGVFPSEVEILKGKLWPFRQDVALEEIQLWLSEYRKQDLVYFWQDDKGKQWGFFVGWFDHNPVRFLGKRKYPKPPGFKLENTDPKKDRPGAKDIKVHDLRNKTPKSKETPDSVGQCRTEVEVKAKAKAKAEVKDLKGAPVLHTSTGLSTVSTARRGLQAIQKTILQIGFKPKPSSKSD